MLPNFGTSIALWRAARTGVLAHTVVPSEIDGRTRASVLIPLVRFNDEPHVVLTVRSFDVEHHKGEVSFPGGVADFHDVDLCMTALRETEEEIGISPGDVEVLGELSHQVTRTGFHITPYIGMIGRIPCKFLKNPTEVERVLEVPISHLLDPANSTDHVLNRDGQVILARSYSWDGVQIFGVTASILQSFLDEVVVQLGI